MKESARSTDFPEAWLTLTEQSSVPEPEFAGALHWISESVTDSTPHSAEQTVTVGLVSVSNPVPVIVRRVPPPKLPVRGAMEEAVSSDS